MILYIFSNIKVCNLIQVCNLFHVITNQYLHLTHTPKINILEQLQKSRQGLIFLKRIFLFQFSMRMSYFSSISNQLHLLVKYPIHMMFRNGLFFFQHPFHFSIEFAGIIKTHRQ